ERYSAQDRLVAKRRDEGQSFDRKTAIRPWQRKSGFRERVGRQKLADTQARAACRYQITPGSDNLLDRLQRTTEKHAGGKTGATRGQSLAHKIGPQAKDHRLRREAQQP